jgi:hypothetical protein
LRVVEKSLLQTQQRNIKKEVLKSIAHNKKVDSAEKTCTDQERFSA